MTGPWRVEFEETGGYDSMTGAWVIYDAQGNQRIVIDQRDFDQEPCDWLYRSAEAEALARSIVAKLNATDAWLVSSGSYSDFSIDAAFSTVEAADAWAARMNENDHARKSNDSIWFPTSDDTYQVERVDLDPPLPDVVERVVRKPLKVQIDPRPSMAEVLESLDIQIETKEQR